MKFHSAFALLLSASASDAFTARQQQKPNISIRMTTQDSEVDLDSTPESEVDLGLTPELKRLTDAFGSIPDEQTRYKQLLYMAQHTKGANDMPAESMIPENKVPGCLSTVYVDGTAEYSEDAGDYVINFIGDSDGLLTRGLVALLVRCLSGTTAEAIQKVDPQFIKVARIEQSLTPGRNNGFLNMLSSMKQKALALDAVARGEGGLEASSTTGEAEEEAPAAIAEDNGHGPMYNAIVAVLQGLQPTSLTLIDNSHQHAGHAGNDMDGESHFELSIVADAFEGLNLVKRHKLIYMMLGEIMPKIHALNIQSLTPEEAERSR